MRNTYANIKTPVASTCGDAKMATNPHEDAEDANYIILDPLLWSLRKWYVLNL